MSIPKESKVFIKKAVECYIQESAKFKVSPETSDVQACFKELNFYLHDECNNALKMAQAKLPFTDLEIKNAQRL